jgi:hypothetical protein
MLNSGAERAHWIPEGYSTIPGATMLLTSDNTQDMQLLPWCNEAIDQGDLRRTQEQIAALGAALNRAVLVLEQYR